MYEQDINLVFHTSELDVFNGLNGPERSLDSFDDYNKPSPDSETAFLQQLHTNNAINYLDSMMGSSSNDPEVFAAQNSCNKHLRMGRMV